MAENRLHCFICGIVQRPRVLGRIPVDDPENRREIINRFRRNLGRPLADIDENLAFVWLVVAPSMMKCDSKMMNHTQD
ncbi:unnamed protein product [Lasius platythorax]|uniref:Uncharacterized protein n=1 Tax=Lasius platythorax TaxID=488582 RepID=A0AAV2MWW3_9HYME